MNSGENHLAKDLGSTGTEIVVDNEPLSEKEKKSSNFSLTDSLQNLHDSISNFTGKHGSEMNLVWATAIYCLITAHFIWATYYFITETSTLLTLDETTCVGYGFYMILFIFITFGFAYPCLIGPYVIKPIKTYAWKPFRSRAEEFFQIRFTVLIAHLIILAAIVVYLIIDTADNRRRLVPLIGLGVFLLFGFLWSKFPGQINWRPVVWGLILQFAFGLLTLRWVTGRNIFQCIGDKVTTFLDYSAEGSAFVYGDELVQEKQVFAFRAITTIYFLNFFINILYHYGIMQKVVLGIGQFLQKIMGTTICESVNSAANIFVGQSEAPLLLKPYLSSLTASEIHCMITSGFATISGSVLAAYISFGANASHLITSSVMSAPAALCYSKLIYPETEQILATKDTIKLTKSHYTSVLDAASQGASQATHIVLAILANLIAFIAFIYFVNGILGWMGELCGYSGEDDIWTVEFVVGYIFTPISFIMGVPWEECVAVGRLIGIKMVVNEFAAFAQFKDAKLTPRTQVIATYAICGFANPGSIGIMISVMSTLVPEKSSVITSVVFRAFIAGSIVCFMTACIAALLIPENLINI